MVKIYGNWCGPDWTDGKNISARNYLLAGGDFRGPCIDKLDCACLQHDKGCSGKQGCTKAADRKLIRTANQILANPLYLITNPRMYAAARIVRDGISLAKPFRQS